MRQSEFKLNTTLKQENLQDNIFMEKKITDVFKSFSKKVFGKTIKKKRLKKELKKQ